MDNFNENEYLSSLFKEELDALNEEENSIDSLYDEIKNHFNEIKGSRSPGTLTFVEKQTSNLATLKSGKIGIIKEKINLKKIAIELSQKDKRNENDDANNSEMFNRLLTHINSNPSYDREKETDNLLSIDMDDINENDVDIDDELSERISLMDINPEEIQIEGEYDNNIVIPSPDKKDTSDDEISDKLTEEIDFTIDNNHEKLELDEITSMVVDEDGNYYLVLDEDLSIIRNYGKEHHPAIEEYFKSEDGIFLAKNIDGEIFEVVSTK